MCVYMCVCVCVCVCVFCRRNNTCSRSSQQILQVCNVSKWRQSSKMTSKCQLAGEISLQYDLVGFFFLHDWLFTLKMWTQNRKKVKSGCVLFFLLWINLLGALGQKLIGGPLLIPIFVPLSVQYLYCSSAHQMQLTLETTRGSLIIFCLKDKKLTSTPVLEYYLPAG